jgi:hypothetical protein
MTTLTSHLLLVAKLPSSILPLLYIAIAAQTFGAKERALQVASARPHYWSSNALQLNTSHWTAHNCEKNSNILIKCHTEGILVGPVI